MYKNNKNFNYLFSKYLINYDKLYNNKIKFLY